MCIRDSLKERPVPQQGRAILSLGVRKYESCLLYTSGRGIRFITPDYKELFRIPDGDKVRNTWSDGERIEHTCRYIDDCHLELGRGMDGIRHICQLADGLVKLWQCMIIENCLRKRI